MIPRQQFGNLDIRKRQIDTLKIFNDNVNEITESEEYNVAFESGGRSFIIIVQLGVNYPNERPKLLITPIIQHHWVNVNTGEIEAAPGLVNYSLHSDLGRIVQAVIREFERYTPTVINSISPVNLPQQGNGTTVLSNQMPTAKSLDNSKDSSPIEFSSKLNDSNLPNLSNLSLDELKQLDNDPQFFEDFIEELSVVQHLNEDLDSMINQVEIISRENESKESHLVELKRKLSDDVTALKNLGEKCDQLNKKYLKKAEDFAPQHIRELLQIAASNSDTECDRHVEQFLNGKIDVQTFLNSYTYSKKVSSERKAKEERLGQQLSALERAGI